MEKEPTPKKKRPTEEEQPVEVVKKEEPTIKVVVNPPLTRGQRVAQALINRAKG